MEKVDTSGLALVEHWKRAADSGLMNENTANALKAACAKVLSVIENWEKLEVRDIDVNDICRRFQNRNHKEYKPGSLDAYKRRFANAVQLFLKYADDPSSWKPPSQDRAQRRERKPTAANGHEEIANQHSAPPQATVLPKGLVDYPFPLREDRIAYLRLPADLKTAEVKRLYAFLTTLAIDFEPKDD